MLCPCIRYAFLRQGHRPELLQNMLDLRKRLRGPPKGPNLSIVITEVSAYPAQPFHEDCINAVAQAAAKLGYSNMPAVSGAGHDAVYMARLAPAGMIFIPCKDGISHNEIESADPEHITAGCNVLLHAMLERAGVA